MHYLALPTTQRLPEHPSSISQNSTGPQLASHHHDVNVNSASRVLTSDSLFGHKQNRTRSWIRLVTAPVPEIPALEQWILERWHLETVNTNGAWVASRPGCDSPSAIQCQL
ncbi:Uncharacterized protein HZ326_10342 [Fusarium oxysporum f. sp. albedinis]|nr:Uncharacterized protein HZ326_10342 [Fusarium oxysporum f. sp. albedinis]